MIDKGNTEETSRPDATSSDPDAEEIAREIARAAEAAKARRIAVLKAHGVKPGEVRNPKGNNGRQLMAAMRRAMDRDGNRDALCLIALDKAMMGDIQWARFVADYDDGRPTQAVDHTSSDGSMSPTTGDTIGAKLRAELAARAAEREEKPEAADEAASGDASD